MSRKIGDPKFKSKGCISKCRPREEIALRIAAIECKVWHYVMYRISERDLKREFSYESQAIKNSNIKSMLDHGLAIDAINQVFGKSQDRVKFTFPTELAEYYGFLS